MVLRKIEEEEECFTPGQVPLPERVVMVTAGDSHTAALTQSGAVWAWGTFRDSSGPIGLVVEGHLQKEPVQVLLLAGTSPLLTPRRCCQELGWSRLPRALIIWCYCRGEILC